MILKRSREEPEIPSSSMADIAFLLIVFFMTTTVFSESIGIHFGLPQEQDEREVSRAAASTTS
jgi:biopolymer transport protein ExbD